MVSVRLQIDPDAVAAAGRTLAGVAQRMASDVAALETTVMGAGDPWRGEGTPIALAYQAVLGQALNALGSYVQQVGEAAVTLTVQARDVALADADSASGLLDVPSGRGVP
jgi:hypothetical protein